MTLRRPIGLAACLLLVAACGAGHKRADAGWSALDAATDDSGEQQPADGWGGADSAPRELAWRFAHGVGGERTATARGAACRGDRCVVCGEVRAGEVFFSVQPIEVDVTTGYVWNLQADGSPRDPMLFAASACVDVDLQRDGRAVIAGSLAGTIDTPDGDVAARFGRRDAFFAALGDTGARFGASFGSAGDDAINEIAIGAEDEIVVTGPFGQGVEGARLQLPDGTSQPAFGGPDDVFVARFSAVGVFQWAKVVPGDGHEEGRGVSVGADGAVLLCGEFDAALRFADGPHQSRGASDVFVAVFDPDGALRWSRSFGGPGADACRGIDPGVGGEVVISGQFAQKVSFDGRSLQARGGRDIFVARLRAADGRVEGVTAFGSVGDDVGCEIEVDARGAVFCAGSSGGSLQHVGGVLDASGAATQFLLRLSPDLALAESGLVAGGEGDTLGFALGLGAEGHGIVVGSLFGAANFGDERILAAGKAPGFYAAGFSVVGR